MTNVREVTNDIFWIGADDRRLALFENTYPLPNGVSYDSYIIMDEKTVLMDCVDASVADIFFENLRNVLNGRLLDFVVVQHMEPDHSATLARLIEMYPDVTIICNAKTETMIHQFFKDTLVAKIQLVKEGEESTTGRHTLKFIMTPMVHWPEVMMTYDENAKILFSADAFGCFGAMNGALFADEVNFNDDYLSEARRYYANIVGKYGAPVQAVLKKSAALDIQMICPLHGFVWRKGLDFLLDKYEKWSTYQPEENAVVVAYASMYGNTAKVAEKAATLLVKKGYPVRVYDLSKTSVDVVLGEIFRASHMILASATHDGGLFAPMAHLIQEMIAHNMQNRKVTLIENGSWAPMAGKEMKTLLDSMKNMTIVEPVLSIKSTLLEAQEKDLEKLVDALVA